MTSTEHTAGKPCPRCVAILELEQRPLGLLKTTLDGHWYLHGRCDVCGAPRIETGPEAGTCPKDRTHTPFGRNNS